MIISRVEAFLRKGLCLPRLEFFKVNRECIMPLKGTCGKSNFLKKIVVILECKTIIVTMIRNHNILPIPKKETETVWAK